MKYLIIMAIPILLNGCAAMRLNPKPCFVKVYLDKKERIVKYTMSRESCVIKFVESDGNAQKIEE